MSSNSRPAKRLRRSANVLSDEENELNTDGPLPLRTLRNSSIVTTKSDGRISSGTKLPQAKRPRTATTKPTSRTTSVKSSPKSSPEQSKKSKKLSIDNGKNKSLHVFFSRVNEDERWRQRSATPDTENYQEAMDDIIDDDSTDEKSLESGGKTEHEASSKTSSFLSTSLFPTSQSKAPPSSSQRFRTPTLPKPSITSKPQSEVRQQEDVKPWADLYGPHSLEELGVHKKKIQDVQAWLIGTLAGKIRQKILVLKGPAGSGKSTTIDLICRAHRCEVVRWQNPDTSESGALSSSLQFAEFVTRGGDYGALSFNAQSLDDETTKRKRILLVEDFPASLTSNSAALESFRSVLLQAAASDAVSTTFGKGFDIPSRSPIVLVISETLVSSFTGFSDSFTAQRLLGPELVNHYGVSVLEFNPVAPTFLSKSLDIVIKKEARDSGRRRIPGPALLQKLAEMGDIRNAVNSLQLLCTRGDDTGDWSGTVAAIAHSKRGAKSRSDLSEAEENSIKLINSRETTLDMFHAAGKVCYNKRLDPKSAAVGAQPLPNPPDHLMHLHRPEVSQVDVDDLLNETGTDVQTFISTVHQNYVLSCNHNDFVDHMDGCSSFLSDSELLDPNSKLLTRSRARVGARRNIFQLGTSDSLRQDEISFNVATRGVLFSLPCPVSRATLPGARKMDAFKMFYPASLRIWKPTEENNDLIELIIARLSGRQSTKVTSAHEESVSSWRARSNAFAAEPSLTLDDDDNNNNHSRTNLNKDLLILDILPYMTTINGSRGEDVTMIKRITQMRGFDVSTDGEVEEEQANNPFPAATRLTQRVEAAHETLQNRKAAQQQQHLRKKSSTENPPIEKLWIEDDDIEDD